MTNARLGLEPRAPEEIIHDKLSLQSQPLGAGDPETEEKRQQYYFDLALGWDALANNHYDLYSNARAHAAVALPGYAQEKKRNSVKLQPDQLKALAACAEVADIPFTPQNDEIPIPESAFHLNEYLLEEAMRTTARRKQLK
jgi:hypothetical protein